MTRSLSLTQLLWQPSWAGRWSYGQGRSGLLRRLTRCVDAHGNANLLASAATDSWKAVRKAVAVSFSMQVSSLPCDASSRLTDMQQSTATCSNV